MERRHPQTEVGNQVGPALEPHEGWKVGLESSLEWSVDHIGRVLIGVLLEEVRGNLGSRSNSLEPGEVTYSIS